MKFSFIILFFLCVIAAAAQEQPFYSGIEFRQYPAETALDGYAWDSTMAVRSFRYLGKRILLSDYKKFENQIFNQYEFFSNDSFTVRISYEKFDPARHHIDYENYKIDGKVVYGHDGFSSTSFNHIMQYYLKSVEVLKDGKRQFLLPKIEPLLFTFYPGNVCKILGKDLFYLSFAGADGAGSYYGFFLIKNNGDYSCYMGDFAEENYIPLSSDLLSAGKKKYQYLIKENAGRPSWELAVVEAFKPQPDFITGWWNYWKAEGEKNLALCRGIDFSLSIRSDSLYGEWGEIENKPFLLQISEVWKDESDSLLYHLKGYDKLGSHVSAWQGKLRIRYCIQKNWKEYMTTYNRMYVTGEFIFREDKTQKGSGEFTGTFEIIWPNCKLLFSSASLGRSEVRKNFDGYFKRYNHNGIKLTHWTGLNFSGSGRDGYIDSNIQWWKKTK